MLSKLWLCLIFIPFLTGCDSARYYYQVAEGHLKIMSARESISMLVKDKTRPEKERKQLRRVLELREFADKELQLPVENLYSEYVDLHRSHVVWNVIAAPEFSMSPHKWCFPIAGCVSYRGYFAQETAQQYALELQKENYDTYIGGASAYSTLGWFEDPVLNTFLYRGDASLAALLFHEISHNVLYVKGDSAFNESFATTIELEGLARWLKTQPKGDLLQKHIDKKTRRKEFVSLVLEHRKLRINLYKSKIEQAKMREEKSKLIVSLQNDYIQLKDSWGGYAGYDAWFDGPLNNAQLSTVATYHSLVDGLQVLLANHQHDLPSFYEACKQLAALDKKSRHHKIQQLVTHKS